MRRIPLLVCLFVLPWASAASATPPGLEGDIYFATYDLPEGAIGRVGPQGGTRQTVVQGPTGSDAAVSPDGTMLAFTRDGDIWTVPSGGGTPERLTPEDAEPNYHPAWSPDSKRLAYIAAEGSPTYRLETIDVASKSDIEVLALEARSLFQPSWSPDGTTLAFTMTIGLASNSPPRVFSVDRATQTQAAIAPLPSANADWSPDGSLIAYETPRSGGTGVAVAPPGATTAEPIQFAASAPVFSPEGDAIAVATDHGGGNQRIARIERGDDGQWATSDDHLRPLTNGAGYGQRSPSWAVLGGAPPSGGGSPGGGPPSGGGTATPAPAPPLPVYPGRIFFDSTEHDSRREIYSILPGGGDVQRLTRRVGADSDPDVSRPGQAAGERVAYTRGVGGRTEIWTMRPDGSEQRPFIARPDLERAEDPSWSPDGTRVAFAGRFPNEARTSIFIGDEGGHVRRLTTTGADDSRPSLDTGPAWSPNGGVIAFRRVDTDWTPRLCAIEIATNVERCTPTRAELERKYTRCVSATTEFCTYLRERLSIASQRGYPSWDDTQIWSTAGALHRQSRERLALGLGTLVPPYGVYADNDRLGRAPVQVPRTLLGPDRNSSPGDPLPAEHMIRVQVRLSQTVPRYATRSPDRLQVVALLNTEAGDELAIDGYPRLLPITPPMTSLGFPSWQAVTTPLGPTALGQFQSRVSVGLVRTEFRGGTLQTSVRNRENFAIDGELRISRARGGGSGSRAAGARCAGKRRAKFFVAPQSSVTLRVRKVRRGSRACLILRDRTGGQRATAPTRLP